MGEAVEKRSPGGEAETGRATIESRKIFSVSRSVQLNRKHRVQAPFPLILVHDLERHHFIAHGRDKIRPVLPGGVFRADVEYAPLAIVAIDRIQDLGCEQSLVAARRNLRA